MVTSDFVVFIIIIFIIIIISVVVWTFFISPLIDAIELWSSFDKANKLLLKSAKEDSLDDILDEIEIRRIFDQCFTVQYSYLDFLEGFIIYVRKNSTDVQLIKKVISLLRPIIEKEKAEKPYSKIEGKERTLLQIIRDSAMANEHHAVNRNLENLAEEIGKKQKELKSSKRQNWLSLGAGIISIIVSIAFGLWSSSLSDKDVERISREVSSSVKDSINTKIFIENTTRLDTLCVKQ